MPLSKQCYIYSIGTDSLYFDDEKINQDRMLKLRKLVSNTKQDCIKKSAKRLLKKEKEILNHKLDAKVNTGIIRRLRDSDLNDRNRISLFESSLTRACGIKPNELSTDLFQIEFYFYQVMKDLIDNGFLYQGKHYVYFSSSAGSIRKHRGLFIEENLYNKIRLRLTCGLTIDKINEMGGCVINKWLAYLALSSSATDIWENFDIDKAIVCEDYELPVHGLVDYIDASDYSVTRKEMDVSIPMNDGVGMMLDETTRVIRAPFIKGLMVTFPFDKFLKEKCTQDQWVVSDIYGVEHNVIDEGIRYILTKSQFKMWKYYKNFDEYKSFFKQNQCEACYCNMEQAYVPKARINYQMLNSLYDMSDEEIDKLIAPTLVENNKIGMDIQTTMKLLGATEDNPKLNCIQEVIMKVPECIRSQYSKEILKQTKVSLVNQAKAGRLKVNGYYRQASPDLYAYCERLFLGIQNPKGLLNNGEVSMSQFRDGEEVDCLRSPHLYFEHCLRINKRNEDTDKWFTSKCIYTSCNDLISRVLALDWDGDILLVTKDRIIKKVVNRLREQFVPLYFEMRKAAPVAINSENIYNGLIVAFKYGKIGIYSNNCAKIWNSGNITADSLKALKLLVAESNWSIDAAKCLYMPERLEEAKHLITSQTKSKLPHFFIYAKDKDEDTQVEKSNNSTMNRISNAFKYEKVKYANSVGKFDYHWLMKKGVKFCSDEDSVIVQAYNKLFNNRLSLRFNEIEIEQSQEEVWIYKRFRQMLIEEVQLSVDEIVNTLVEYLYNTKKSRTKKILWSCFGEELKENALTNTVHLGKVCKVCGKRFKPRDNANTTYCSEKCYNIFVAQTSAERKRKSRENQNVT